MSRIANPTKPRWNAGQRDTVRRFFRFAVKLGLNQGDIANVLRVSSATVSQMRNEKYTGAVERIVSHMQRTLARWQQRLQVTKPVEFRRTGVTEDVWTALRLAHVRGDISVVLGGTGVGKSIAAEEYRREEPETLYVLCGPGCSPKSLLKALAGKMGEGYRGTQYDMRQSLADLLKGRNQQLIIFDDADWLPESTLQHLCRIQDQSGVGMAFLCTPAFLARLKEKRSQTINQFLGRIGYEVHLESVSDEDLATIAEQFGLSAAALKVVIQNADGQARRAVKGIQNAIVVAQNGEVKAEDLKAAFRQLPRLL